MLCYNLFGDFMKDNLKGIAFFSIIFIIVDQVLKIFISSKIVINHGVILIKNLLSITLVHNDGAAFSILSGNRLLLIVIGLLALIGVSLYLNSIDYLSGYDTFTYSLLIGGVVGNLIDRIVHGFVIDYISLNIFGYNFPIFNFADICIVLSIVLIIVNTIKGDLWNS